MDVVWSDPPHPSPNSFLPCLPEGRHIHHSLPDDGDLRGKFTTTTTGLASPHNLSVQISIISSLTPPAFSQELTFQASPGLNHLNWPRGFLGGVPFIRGFKRLLPRSNRPPETSYDGDSACSACAARALLHVSWEWGRRGRDCRHVGPLLRQ